MKLRILIFAVCIFVIITLQSTLLDYVQICGIKPNLILVFAISVALAGGNPEGAVIGFFCGLAQDAVSGKVLGFYSLLGLYLGLVVGSTNRRLYRENFFVIIFFTFISTVVYELMVHFLTEFARGQINLLFSFRYIIFPEAVYNCIVSIFIFLIVLKINERFKTKGKLPRKY